MTAPLLYCPGKAFPPSILSFPCSDAYTVHNKIVKEVIPIVIPLSHTVSGSRCRIVWIASNPHQKQRLADLGFLPDEVVTAEWKVLRGFLGFYRIRGTTCALRRKTANEIFVEQI